MIFLWVLLLAVPVSCVAHLRAFSPPSYSLTIGCEYRNVLYFLYYCNRTRLCYLSKITLSPTCFDRPVFIVSSFSAFVLVIFYKATLSYTVVFFQVTVFAYFDGFLFYSSC